VTLTRGIIFIRPSTILIIDEAASATQHMIQQIFNLAPDARDLKFDRDIVYFRLGEKGVTVKLRQIRKASGVNHYYGDEDAVRGFISPQQGTLVPVHQLEFESLGNGVIFITQITVIEPDEDVPIIEVDPNNPYRDIMVYYVDGSTLTINIEQKSSPDSLIKLNAERESDQ
jgi:hypothetical protein